MVKYMKTGVVYEIKNRKAVIMQAGGIFVSVDAKPGWKKGDVVSVKAGGNTYQSLYAAAACFVIMAFFSVGAFRLYFTETAIVSLDINPSIEMGINRFDRVIRVSDYNDDGLKIIDSVNLMHREYSGAVGELLTSEPISKYFREDAEDKVWIKVAVHSEIPAKNTQMPQSIIKEVESINATRSMNANAADASPNVINKTASPQMQKVKFRVDCEVVSGELINEAHEHNLTPGKYSEILGLVELAPEKEVDDCRDMSIMEIKRIKEAYAADTRSANGADDEDSTDSANSESNADGESDSDGNADGAGDAEDASEDASGEAGGVDDADGGLYEQSEDDIAGEYGNDNENWEEGGEDGGAGEYGEEGGDGEAGDMGDASDVYRADGEDVDDGEAGAFGEDGGDGGEADAAGDEPDGFQSAGGYGESDESGLNDGQTDIDASGLDDEDNATDKLSELDEFDANGVKGNAHDINNGDDADDAADDDADALIDANDFDNVETVKPDEVYRPDILKNPGATDETAMTDIYGNKINGGNRSGNNARRNNGNDKRR